MNKGFCCKSCKKNDDLCCKQCSDDNFSQYERDESVPLYSFETAKQLIFDCIMELNYKAQGFSDEQIANKLFGVLHELDKMDVADSKRDNIL